MLRRCVWSRNIKNGCSIYIYDISRLRVNIILTFTSGYPQWSLSLRFAHQKPCMRLSSLPYALHAPPISFSIYISRTIFVERYTSVSSSLCSFIHSHVTPSLLDQNILLNTLLCILIVVMFMYSYWQLCSVLYTRCQLAFSGHPDWDFSVLFPQLQGKYQGIPRKEGARLALFQISEFCCSMYCLCRLCCSMYCLCVNVYCTTATGCQPNCS